MSSATLYMQSTGNYRPLLPRIREKGQGGGMRNTLIRYIQTQYKDGVGWHGNDAYYLSQYENPTNITHIVIDFNNGRIFVSQIIRS
ncbi:hypothetical protein FRX31_005183 [Thalictrum thalictroides]|uniref:Uncharacterized protein n=1 Tax=Thalictrum thalictroides TaxID=46969 RepID=A0A7J6X9Z4_THATH|nr:hypothetical protein FRX31_005183 [Thalictrum thalictroides]